MNAGATLEVYRYTLPLAQPLHLPFYTLTERTGYVVRLTRDDGTIGLGDAAPLPGFSRESADDLQHWLQQAVEPPPPSLRFALDTAETSAWPTSPGVPINGLISRGCADLRGAARALLQSGYRAVKLKVGNDTLENDIAAVHAVAAELDHRCPLRLDANRAWDWENALAFARAVAGLNIEYIEEPLCDPERLAEFNSASGMPIALDETTLNAPLCESLLQSGRVAAVILKPTLLGSVDTVRSLVAAARSHGAKPVFSACFESGLGLTAIARMAAAFAPNIPCGLDTYRWLARDVLRVPPTLHDGCFIPSYPLELNMENLEPISHV